jgi:hypothetical protein
MRIKIQELEKEKNFHGFVDLSSTALREIEKLKAPIKNVSNVSCAVSQEMFNDKENHSEVCESQGKSRLPQCVSEYNRFKTTP